MRACLLCGNPTKRPEYSCCSRACASRLNGREQAVPVVERLLSKVDFSGCSAGETCWNWTGATNDGGYACLKVKGHGGSGAHRAAYREFVGPIPAGMLVCHKCDNRLCVNPDHLFLGDYNDNAGDCFRKGRNARGKTHARTRLTEEQVLEIRRLRALGGTTLRRLAERFGVSFQAIHDIAIGRIWKCLPLASSPTEPGQSTKGAQ